MPSASRPLKAALPAQQPDSPTMVVRTTAELLVLVAHRDEAAFSEFYAAQLPMVTALAFRLLRDFHQAEEVAQEALLQIWQLAHRFDPSRGSAVAWITHITRARAIDRIRQSESSRIRDDRHAAADRSPDFDTVVETVFNHLDVSLVQNGLLMVTAVQREALVLAFYTDRTYELIARDLGIPLGTLKTRVRDGLIRMRRGLAVQEAVSGAA